MKVTREEIIKIRIKLLKEMHQYIINMGDESVYLRWIYVGVPDEPSEEDFEFIADTDEEWNDVCKIFGELTKEKKSGGNA